MMKIFKNYYALLLILLFTANIANAQSVSGTPSNTGCKNSGIVTATPSGLGANPQYQLLKAGVVVAPVSGDVTQFTNNAVFTGLATGTYVLKARADAVSPMVTSTNITVTDGYTDMTVATPTKVLSCVGGTVALTTTITGGKANYIYSIALQSSPSTAIETSAATSATSYTFAALPKEDYLVSVTDVCGQTVTSATSISNPSITLADIKLGSIAYVTRNGLICTNPINFINELGFQYVASSTGISASDAANFTWKIKYQGVLYGKDVNADGYSDAAGAGFSLSTTSFSMPLAATRAGILADFPNMAVVLIDACGNTKEFPVNNYRGGIVTSNCGGSSWVRVSLGAGLVCLPLNITFTNTANPADVVNVSVTASYQSFTGNLTPGQNYSFTYTDGEGYTSGLITNPASGIISIPATSQYSVTPFTFGVQQALNNLDYAAMGIRATPYTTGDVLTYTVTASNNPLVPVGYTNTTTASLLGEIRLPRVNATDPVGYWPEGTYTLSVTGPCGTADITRTINGYTASLTGHTITPVCGGFNYVLNGVFDVASAYEVIIISGPASVGQKRDLASTTASLPFNGLVAGTYVFGVRIKGGTTNVLTETVTYDATSVITVDKSNTGGFVCTAGATNGVLTITASSASPAPGNVLEYRLSTDGGATYGSYQSANTFSGLSEGTYYYQVKDGCGNVITESAQIGVAAAPVASVNGIANAATFCAGATGSTVQLGLDVNVPNSTYLWTGPGLTAANNTLKNPQINLADLSVGVNNYSVTVTLGAPCNSISNANLAITILALPKVVTNAASACTPNTVDLTASAVTAGSDAGLTYSYFTDAAGTITLSNPSAVAVSNTYYIKGDNGTCSDIKPVVATINPLPVASIAYSNSPYCNRATAAVTQTGVSGGTYSSTTGLSINSASGLINLAASTPATYTVTYIFSDGTCSNTTSASITISSTVLPSALPDVTVECSATPTAPTLIDPCSGTLTATTTTTFPVTTPGTTVVTWTFDYGNGYTQTVNQNVILTNIAAPTLALTQPTCAVATGSITVTSPLGTGLEYSINGTTFQTSANFTSLGVGTYSVLVRNVSSSCVSVPTTDFIVAATGCCVQPATPTLTTLQPTCLVATGSIIITNPTGAGIEYSTDGINYQTSSTFANLAAGTYSVSARNTPACVSTSVVVTINAQPSTPNTASVVIDQPTCSVATGSITIASPTSIGLTYSLNSGAFQTSNSFTNLSAGTYSISVSNGTCTSAPISAVVNQQPITPSTPIVTITQQTCSLLTGTITVDLPSSGVTYSIDGINYQASNIFSGLSYGDYAVTAKGNSGGCISSPTLATVIYVSRVVKCVPLEIIKTK